MSIEGYVGGALLLFWIGCMVWSNRRTTARLTALSDQLDGSLEGGANPFALFYSAKIHGIYHGRQFEVWRDQTQKSTSRTQISLAFRHPEQIAKLTKEDWADVQNWMKMDAPHDVVEMKGAYELLGECVYWVKSGSMPDLMQAPALLDYLEPVVSG